MSEVVSATGLTKVYGKVRAVSDLNLSVEKGKYSASWAPMAQERLPP